jgi:uncharacterized protein (TIGR03663 family)
LIKHAFIMICWFAVIGSGAVLRFEQLGKRPFHADEATGARLTAARMESGDYHFDPVHYHGPLLSRLAIPLCQVRGESRWQEMTKTGPRLLTAIAGSLLLLVPLLWRRRFGDAPPLLAAALLATSPLLVYYSRFADPRAPLGNPGIFDRLDVRYQGKLRYQHHRLVGCGAVDRRGKPQVT